MLVVGRFDPSGQQQIDAALLPAVRPPQRLRGFTRLSRFVGLARLGGDCTHAREVDMKRLSGPLVLVMATASAGCRSAANQELLERDLRHQEDRIYHLESNLADYKQWLEATRLENEVFREQLAKTSPTTSHAAQADRGTRGLQPAGGEPAGGGAPSAV